MQDVDPGDRGGRDVAQLPWDRDGEPRRRITDLRGARTKRRRACSVVAGVGFSPPRSVNLPFCHLGLLKGRFSSL